MRIGIDIDDTICKTNEKLVELALYYDQKYLLGKGFKDSNAYYFTEMLYWTKKNKDDFLKFANEQKIHQNVEEIKDAQKVINKLYQEGNNIIFITMRSGEKEVETITKKWLKEHNFLYHKLICNAKEKGLVGAQEKIDLLIDDAEVNLKNAQAHNIDTLLMSTKYNRKETEFKRVESWQSIYEYVNGGKTWED